MPFWLDPSAPLVLALALALDLLLGEPPTRLHPVGWLGQLIAGLEEAAPFGGRGWQLAYGLLLVVLVVELAGLVGLGLARLAAELPNAPRVVLQAVGLKLAFSLRALGREADRVRLAVERDDLPSAQKALRALVSRPTQGLDAAGAASAAVESVAENASDSLVAPLLYYGLFGLPGAFVYRAINTLDAMIGYHGPYEYLGKAAARLDDLLNLVPARLTALMIVVAAPFAGGSARRALVTLRADRGRTESPNAGWPMSAAAGALGVRLEKKGHYVLGGGLAHPAPADVARAVQLLYGCAGLALLALAAYLLVA